MNPLLGQVSLFAFYFAPTNWMECAGQTLNISTYPALFSLLDTKFGGDGRTTFCLPDLRNITTLPCNMKYFIAVQGAYPARQ